MNQRKRVWVLVGLLVIAITTTLLSACWANPLYTFNSPLPWTIFEDRDLQLGILDWLRWLGF